MRQILQNIGAVRCVHRPSFGLRSVDKMIYVDGESADKNLMKRQSARRAEAFLGGEARSAREVYITTVRTAKSDLQRRQRQ